MKKTMKQPVVTKNAKAVTSVKITEKKKKKVSATDLVEVTDTSMLISIDIKRQSEALIASLEIDEDQRLFPYTVFPRLLVGWQTVGFISSYEMKVSSEFPLPQIIVRFVEKMSAKDVKELPPEARAQIEQAMALVRQFPFVKVECPLLAP